MSLAQRSYRKQPGATVAHLGTRIAIERLRNRPMRAPGPIAWQIMDRIGKHELLPATVKAALLKKQWQPPAPRKVVR